MRRPWGTEQLASDVVDFVAEIFAEGKKKDKVVTHQIVERVKQHALLVRTEGGKFAFDHPEFYHFFLGEAVGRMIVKRDASSLKHAFRPAVLPQLAVETAARFIVHIGQSVTDVIAVVDAVFAGEPRMSIVKENLSGIVIHLVDISGGRNVLIEGGTFPPESLKGRKLADVSFSKCYFQRTSLEHSSLAKCRFEGCEFEGIELRDSMEVNGATLRDCICHEVVPRGEDLSVFAPGAIRSALVAGGFTVEVAQAASPDLSEPRTVDKEVLLTERLIRGFIRSSGINENSIHKRLGIQATFFFRDVFPALEKAGILKEVTFRGRGTQRRFGFGLRLETITEALENCNGNFQTFLALAQSSSARPTHHV